MEILFIERSSSACNIVKRMIVHNLPKFCTYTIHDDNNSDYSKNFSHQKSQ